MRIAVDFVCWAAGSIVSILKTRERSNGCRAEVDSCDILTEVARIDMIVEIDAFDIGQSRCWTELLQIVQDGIGTVHIGEGQQGGERQRSEIRIEPIGENVSRGRIRMQCQMKFVELLVVDIVCRRAIAAARDNQRCRHKERLVSRLTSFAFERRRDRCESYPSNWEACRASDASSWTTRRSVQLRRAIDARIGRRRRR